MTVLVTYASKYGATAGIAERIATTLTAAGHEALAQPVGTATGLDEAEAVVVGSAVYFGSWLKPATAFVEKHHETLAGRPVWLFSSGPLPDAVVPGKVAERETEAEAEDKGVAAMQVSLGARGHQVFDGALVAKKLGLRDRMIRVLPAGRALLPEVDGRDWPAIEEWARAIGRELDTMS